MMVMIREIKQAARGVLSWVMDDWLKLRRHSDTVLQFLFNDLDPSDAVDIKKLLIELYDRKLISRSSLQLKMDLDPDIESANRETEKQRIDLLDEKQVKPIVDMVMAGVLSVEAAQAMLGLKPEQAPRAAEVEPVGQAQANVSGQICDGCVHFDEESNVCGVHKCERSFDAAACRFYERV